VVLNSCKKGDAFLCFFYFMASEVEGVKYGIGRETHGSKGVGVRSC